MSNTCVVRVAKLVDDINLKQENKEYNPAKVFINSDDSDVSANWDKKRLLVQLLADNTTAALHQTIENSDVLDKLYMPCIGSKLTRVIRYNKNITTKLNKLQKVHADL